MRNQSRKLTTFSINPLWLLRALGIRRASLGLYDHTTVIYNHGFDFLGDGQLQNLEPMYYLSKHSPVVGNGGVSGVYMKDKTR